MPSNHLILWCPLLLPTNFPSIQVFSSESVLPIRWPKYWSFSFSISPANEYSGLISFRIDRFDLLAVQGTLKNLLQHYSLKASILWHSAFFMVQFSHPYMTTRKTIALRILEWVAISFSNAWKWKVKVKLLSRVWLLATPWTAAHQALLSMGFSRQEYWSFSFSIIPFKEIPGLISFRMDWLDLLQSKRLSRVFFNTTVQKHQFFSTQLSSQFNSHIHKWPLEKP